MMKYLAFFLFVFIACENKKQVDSLPNGQPWYDMQGNRINAHGGSIYHENGTYYWYGEYFEPIIEGTEEKNFYGFKCYTSTDLLNWQDEGVILEASKDNTDLHFYNNNLGNPYVLFNQATKKYVLWTKMGRAGYADMGLGVCTADNPLGPFQVINKIFPNDTIPHAGDFTLWQEGQQAWVVFNCAHKNIVTADLSDDYLGVSGNYSWHWPNQGPPLGREAPAIMKAKNRFFIITSGTTGYDPNPGEYAVTEHIHGDYQIKGNPFIGENSEISFDAQGRNIFQPVDRPDTYYLLMDRWKEENLYESTNVILPVHLVSQDSIYIKWIDEFKP
jgi:hypothetical protein